MNIELETLKMFELYTKMARELCTNMRQVFSDDKESFLLDQPLSTNFECLFDRLYDEDPSQEFIIYLNEQWKWHLHGEHCLFESDKGTQIEANIYNTDLVDIAFFNIFIKSCAEANPLYQALDNIDFNSTAILFDQLVQKQLLYPQDSTQFGLVNAISNKYKHHTES